MLNSESGVIRWIHGLVGLIRFTRRWSRDGVFVTFVVQWVDIRVRFKCGRVQFTQDKGDVSNFEHVWYGTGGWVEYGLYIRDEGKVVVQKLYHVPTQICLWLLWLQIRRLRDICLLLSSLSSHGRNTKCACVILHLFLRARRPEH